MRRSTIVYLILFGIVFGAAYYLNNRQKTAGLETPTGTATPIEYLFTSADGLPTSIHIKSKAGDILEVTRNAENAWAMTLPVEAAADQAAVEAAATQVTTMRILEHVPNLSPEAVGLNIPEYTLKVKFTSGVERMSEIGVLTPTESGYYVRGENGEILIVSRSSVDPLIGLLNNPPYAPTETPAPTPMP